MPLEIIGITYYVMLLSFELLSFVDLLIISVLAIPVLGVGRLVLAAGLTVGAIVFCSGQIVHSGQFFTIFMTLAINYLLAFSLLKDLSRLSMPRIITAFILYVALLVSFSGDPLALHSAGAWYRTCLFFASLGLASGVFNGDDGVEWFSPLNKKGNLREMLVARVLLAGLIGIQIQSVLSPLFSVAYREKECTYGDSTIRRSLLGALTVIPLAQIFLQFWIQLIAIRFQLVQRFLPYALIFESKPKFLPGSAEFVGISSCFLLFIAGVLVLSRWGHGGSRLVGGMGTLFAAFISALFIMQTEDLYQCVLLILVCGIAGVSTFTAVSGRMLCSLTTAVFLCGALVGNLPVYYLRRQTFVHQTKVAVASNDKSGRASVEAAYELGLVGGSAAIVQTVRGNLSSRLTVNEMCDESLIAEGVRRKHGRGSFLCSEFKDLRKALDISNCENPGPRGRTGSLEDEINRTIIMLSHHSHAYSFCSSPEENTGAVGPSSWLMLFYEIVQVIIKSISNIYDLLQILTYGIRLQLSIVPYILFELYSHH